MDQPALVIVATGWPLLLNVGSFSNDELEHLSLEERGTLLLLWGILLPTGLEMNRLIRGQQPFVCLGAGPLTSEGERLIAGARLPTRVY